MGIFRKKLGLPTWARIVIGAGGALMMLISVASAPQALQDTLANVPFLQQPTPWSVVVALAIVVLYVAVRSGYSLPESKEPATVLPTEVPPVVTSTEPRTESQDDVGGDEAPTGFELYRTEGERTFARGDLGAELENVDHAWVIFESGDPLVRGRVTEDGGGWQTFNVLNGHQMGKIRRALFSDPEARPFVGFEKLSLERSVHAATSSALEEGVRVRWWGGLAPHVVIGFGPVGGQGWVRWLTPIPSNCQGEGSSGWPSTVIYEAQHPEWFRDWVSWYDGMWNRSVEQRATPTDPATPSGSDK